MSSPNERNTELDNFIETYIDDLYSNTNSSEYRKPCQPKVLSQSKSFCISRETDKIFDNYKNRRNAIEYKRYGQFISIGYDDDPSNKEIIDVFDLYNILKISKFHRNKQRNSFIEKIKNFFKT